MSSARDRAVDTAVAAGVAAVLATIVSAGQGGRAGTVAYVWAAGLGALMFWRRRYASTVLFLTVLGLFAYYAAGLPAIGVAVPVAAALFAAAEAGHRRTSIAVAAGVLTVSMVFRLLEGQNFHYVVLYEGIGHVALMAAAIALGELVRARRRITRLTGRQIELEAARRVNEHNLALSRELHDSIGHTLTVAAIHANVARQEATRRPEAAAVALDHVAEAVSEALTRLRGTVRDLRTATPARRPGPEDVGALLESARAAGFRVHAEVDAAEVTGVAFQVIRESITNVLRHSTGRTVDVQVCRRADGTLLVRVTDDGRGGSMSDEGTGLTGLRERVGELGGHVEAGPTAAGWQVEAVLPEAAPPQAPLPDAPSLHAALPPLRPPHAPLPQALLPPATLPHAPSFHAASHHTPLPPATPPHAPLRQVPSPPATPSHAPSSHAPSPHAPSPHRSLLHAPTTPPHTPSLHAPLPPAADVARGGQSAVGDSGD